MPKINTLVKEKFKSINVALKLQAKEYERRLNALNGEAERLRNIQTNYIPREVYDENKKETDIKLEELKSYKDMQIGKSIIITVIVSVLVSFVSGITIYFITK